MSAADAAGVAPLPDRAPSGADTEHWTFHHRLLYRLVAGAAGARTEDLQLLYDAVAPLAYRGTTTEPCDSRRYRRKLLTELAEAGVIGVHDTPRGRVWVPALE